MLYRIIKKVIIVFTLLLLSFVSYDYFCTGMYWLGTILTLILSGIMYYQVKSILQNRKVYKG